MRNPGLKFALAAASIVTLASANYWTSCSHLQAIERAAFALADSFNIDESTESQRVQGDAVGRLGETLPSASTRRLAVVSSAELLQPIRSQYRWEGWYYIGVLSVIAIIGIVIVNPTLQQLQHADTLSKQLTAARNRTAERMATLEQRIRELTLSEATYCKLSRDQKSILDGLPQGVLVVRPEDGMRYANRAARRLLEIDWAIHFDGRLQPEADIRQLRVKLYHDDGITEYQDEESPFCPNSALEPFPPTDIFVRRESEPREIWLNVCRQRLRQDDGPNSEVLVRLEDVTARKSQHSDREGVGRLHQQILDALPIAVVRKDTEGRVVFANASFCRLTAVPRESVIAKTNYDLFPESMARKRTLDETMVLQTDTVYSDIERFVSPEGESLYMEVLETPVRDPAGRIVGIQAMFRDVTSSRLAEQEREDLIWKRMEAERSAIIEQIAEGLTEEGTGVLQQLQACMRMVSSALDETGQMFEIASDIQAVEHRLDRWIENLRGYTSHVELQRAPANLHDILQAAWHCASRTQKARHLSFIELGTDLDLSCEVDTLKLQKAFIGLLEDCLNNSNPILRIEVTYSLTTRQDRPALRVTIRDNGQGLSLNTASHLFEPFPAVTTTRSGFRAAMAKRMIRAHGGEIEIGRLVAPGTEFIVTLPRNCD